MNEFKIGDKVRYVTGRTLRINEIYTVSSISWSANGIEQITLEEKGVDLYYPVHHFKLANDQLQKMFSERQIFVGYEFYEFKPGERVICISNLNFPPLETEERYTISGKAYRDGFYTLSEFKEGFGFPYFCFESLEEEDK